MAMFAAAEKFLAKYLGGRFQEGGTPETMTRLKEITVDPATVAMPKRAEASAAAPQIVADLPTGVYKYKAISRQVKTRST
jgi:hypothetical protein